MGHPLIDEFCRAYSLDQSFLRRCQREFREQVQPLLDPLDPPLGAADQDVAAVVEEDGAESEDEA